MIRKIKKLLFEAPPSYPAHLGRFFLLNNIIFLFGIFFHLSFALFFLAINKPQLYYIDIISLFIYCVAIVSNRNGWKTFAVILICIDVLIHPIYNVYMIGYQSGFQFYLFLLLIAPTVMLRTKTTLKLSLGLATIICILSINYLSTEITPKHFLTPEILEILFYSNLSIVSCLLFATTFFQGNLIVNFEDKALTEHKKSEKLLHNIFPKKIVNELKATGKAKPRKFESVTIMFTDFVSFTEIVSSTPELTLVQELNEIFSRFDDIMEEEGLEKIETIGDAYVAACGLPQKNNDHAHKSIIAAKKMLAFLEDRNTHQPIKWNMRVGIHSGSIITGVVGKKKFRFNLFGDTINVASRMESNSTAGRINISPTTYELVKNIVSCSPRGKISVKGKGAIDMYYVD